jgi:hypothetical protein
LHKSNKFIVQVLSFIICFSFISCEIGQDIYLDSGLKLTSDSIINGNLTAEHELPSVVGLMLAGIEGRTKKGSGNFCSGTLIAPDVVLTAAHCTYANFWMSIVKSKQTNHLWISFQNNLHGLGRDYLKLPSDSIRAAHYVYPSTFHLFNLLEDPSVEENSFLANLQDIALLFLEHPVKHTKPTPILRSNQFHKVEVGSKLIIAGYGLSIPKAKYRDYTQSLRSSEPPRESIVEVNATNELDDEREYLSVLNHSAGYVFEIGKYELSLGDRLSSSNPTIQKGLGRKCFGDSGGPGLVKTDNGEYRVATVASRLNGEYDCLSSTIETYVPAWADWIEQQMKINCANGVRVKSVCEGTFKPNY